MSHHLKLPPDSHFEPFDCPASSHTFAFHDLLHASTLYVCFALSLMSFFFLDKGLKEKCPETDRLKVIQTRDEEGNDETFLALE